MSKRTKLILWLLGIILLFSFIFLIWAIDTNRIGIFAESEGPIIESSTELKSLPSPDQSTFNKIFGFILKPFIK